MMSVIFFALGLTREPFRREIGWILFIFDSCCVQLAAIVLYALQQRCQVRLVRDICVPFPFQFSIFSSFLFRFINLFTLLIRSLLPI